MGSVQVPGASRAPGQGQRCPQNQGSQWVMSQTYIPAALRRLVRERSGDRCEYCLIPESVAFAPHWIDHIVAEKHGGMADADNLANSCVLCNQSKGSDLTSIRSEER